MDHIKGTAFGTLVMDLAGEPESCREALNYLRSRDLRVEVLTDDSVN
jgi:ABC-type methionine transport system ATPase subunit